MKKSKEVSREPYASREEAENDLINLSIECARQKLIDGTAAASTINYYLKLGSTKEKIERELMDKQIALLEAKVENLNLSKGEAAAYMEAVNAMKSYSYNGGN